MSGRAERAGVVAMVVATLLWGGTFVAIRDSVRTLTPAALVFGRFAVAAALFWFFALITRRFPDRGNWIVGAGNGVLMAGAFVFQALGLRSTSAGSSAFLTCAGTLFAAFFAWPLLRQRPDRVLVSGIALALVGSALLSLDRAMHLGTGEMITLFAASLYALQIVWVARHARALDPFRLVTAQATTVTLLLAPFAVSGLGAYQRLDSRGWLDFAYLAVAGSSLAPLLQVHAQRSLSAGRIGLLFALEPVFALVFALGLGGERFEPRWWLGASLILSAVLWVEGRAAWGAGPSTT